MRNDTVLFPTNTGSILSIVDVALFTRGNFTIGDNGVDTTLSDAGFGEVDW